MKYYGLIFLSFFIFSSVFSQNQDSTEKYIWKNESKNVCAVIEIYGLQKTKISNCIYFLNKKDTIVNNESDSLFNKIINLPSLSSPIIKVSFYNFYDTTQKNSTKFFAQELMEEILPDIKMRYRNLPADNFIVAGLNDFAEVALLAAVGNVTKINKTALFFKNYNPNEIFLYEIKKVSKLLKGKIYISVNNSENEDLFTDVLATNLALNSSLVLYKLDQFTNENKLDYFTEAYKWLMADGNNFIIKTDD